MRCGCSNVNEKGMAPNARVLAEAGKQYAVYVRAGTRRELTLNLPEGNYHAEWINTRTGAVEREETFNHPGGERSLTAPLTRKTSRFACAG